MSAYGHVPGESVECLSLAVELRKEHCVDPSSGEPLMRVGFKIGGGIDQDPSRAPFVYPDNWNVFEGIYITFIEPDSPAEKAGLRQHDKILRVNGNDFTMVTHERAVKFIKRDAILHLLVARFSLDSLCPRQEAPSSLSSSHN